MPEFMDEDQNPQHGNGRQDSDYDGHVRRWCSLKFFGTILPGLAGREAKGAFPRAAGPRCSGRAWPVKRKPISLVVNLGSYQARGKIPGPAVDREHLTQVGEIAGFMGLHGP